MRRLKQKNAASKGGDAQSCSPDLSAISTSAKDVLHLRIDMLNSVLLQRDKMFMLSIEIIKKWKDKCEIQETQIEDLRKLNSNHPRSDACSEGTIFSEKSPTSKADLSTELECLHEDHCIEFEGGMVHVATKDLLKSRKRNASNPNR
jgi:hypothetical protein